MQHLWSMIMTVYCARLYQHTRIASLIILTLQNDDVDYSINIKNKSIALTLTLHKSLILDMCNKRQCLCQTVMKEGEKKKR